MTIKEAKELTKNEDGVFVIPSGAIFPVIPAYYGANAITLIFGKPSDIPFTPSGDIGHNRFISLEDFSDEIEAEANRLKLMDKLKHTFK